MDHPTLTPLLKAEDIYQELERLCLPILESYLDDLIKHDRAAITDRTPFLHFTGSTGTHMIRLYPADHEMWPNNGEQVPYLFGIANREHILKNGVVEAVAYMPKVNRNQLALYYDGTKLHKISQHNAEEVSRIYADGIRKQWKRSAAS